MLEFFYECLSEQRGYTIFFDEKQLLEELLLYFSNYENNHWMEIDAKTIWVKESLAFNILEYLEKNFDANSLFLIEAQHQSPLSGQNYKKPLHFLCELKKASWIDSVIDEGRIIPHYQPIVKAPIGEKPTIVGHELLSRGIARDGGFIAPLDMLEAARMRNRLFDLDRACRISCVNHAGRINNQLVFINFIPTAIYAPENCLATTIHYIHKKNIRPENIIFEVVESDEVDDIEHLKTILNYYKQHGFQYALDDVGTGVNSLKKISELEPSIVKLAREYVHGVAIDSVKQHMARSLLQVADQIDAEALAEGVECKEDIDYLQKLGYTLFQGYFFSRPKSNPVTVLPDEVYC